MEDFEGLGVFYLGRHFDADQKRRKDELLLYDSKDLVTHAVCVGMTGSGKTGLCVGLIEEAAIDGIPAIVIDPKGDLSNLLLTFPELRAEDLEPWVNPDEAQSKGLTTAAYAAQQAEFWRKGLADWGQSVDRIRRLREAAEFAVYTPGSTAAAPVSILQSFSAPPPELVQDPDLLRERIGTTVSSLLALLGIEANPLQSREHILLSTLFDLAWKQGSTLDLPRLIQLIQTPPLAKIGVLDLDSFYPSKERYELAMMINNLLAAPGFEAWLQGEPLDVGRILHNAAGRPRVAVFSISHLNDQERMFFVSLLLTQVVGWMRTQPGTSSLRALLYMDEVFGYFPPTANPPSKTPLLTLLKQARAFGLGVVLATQNPVDLDYKGLSNTGTWFIGRLQTERDRMRLLDGLEGAMSTSTGFDRQAMDSLLSQLQSRVFFLHNVHDREPSLFQTRWTLSYLRGPLMRSQLKELAGRQSSRPQEPAPAPATPSAPALPEPQAREAARPVLPPDVPQRFAPLSGGREAVAYVPFLYGSARVYYADAKIGVAVEQPVRRALRLSAESPTVDWAGSEETTIEESDLERFPSDEAAYGGLPPEAARGKSYPIWSRQFADWVVRNQTLTLLKSPALGEVSRPGESERDFRIRLQQKAREARDRQIEKLRQTYASRLMAIEERIRRARQAVERESEQASQAKLQTAISFGTTVLGALFGRKKLSTSTLGRATTAARGVGRSMKESQDIDRAQETVQVLERQLADLQEELQIQTEEIASRIDPMTEQLQSYELRPKKGNVSIQLFTLVWKAPDA